MKTLMKTALVLAGLAAIAVPAAAQAPGPGFGLNPNCPYVQQDRDDATTALPARPMRMMRRMQAEDGTCPRLNGQTAVLPDGATKVPGLRDGTGPWWLRQATPDKTD